MVVFYSGTGAGPWKGGIRAEFGEHTGGSCCGVQVPPWLWDQGVSTPLGFRPPYLTLFPPCPHQWGPSRPQLSHRRAPRWLCLPGDSGRSVSLGKQHVFERSRAQAAPSSYRMATIARETELSSAAPPSGDFSQARMVPSHLCPCACPAFPFSSPHGSFPRDFHQAGWEGPGMQHGHFTSIDHL